MPQALRSKSSGAVFLNVLGMYPLELHVPGVGQTSVPQGLADGKI